MATNRAKKVFLCFKKTYGTLEELADQLMEAVQKLSPEDQKKWREQIPNRPRRANRTREGEWIQ